MAFGFFSNKEDFADIIYTGGYIHTMDPEMPAADAVACRDGVIMRVGTDEDMQDIVGDETEVFDLEGMHLFPGFIEANASPVLDAIDEDVCFVIGEDENIDDILSELADHISEHFSEDPEDAYDDGTVSPADDDYFEIPDVVFGYGFDPSLIKDMELDERQKLLDEVCDEMPVLLLSEDGLTAWFNTIAYDVVAAVAEENGTQILTLPFMLSVLSSVDSASFEPSAFEVIRGYCREGYTTVFEGSASAYLNSIFEDLQMALINEGNQKLRFINGIYICTEVDPSYIDMQLRDHKANYQELNGMVMGGIVSAHIHDGNLSGPYLTDMMRAAAARSGTVLLEAGTPEDVQLCRSAIQSFREKAGGKMDIMLSHEGELSEDDTHFEYELLPEAATAEEEIRTRTVVAAEKLGVSEILGSISEGKYADFAVFDEDLSQSRMVNGELPDGELTIIGGQIVYDVADDPDSLWGMMNDTQIV